MYFDGKADGSYDNQVLFAGGVKDSATLTALYDAAWKRAQAGATKPTILTGSDLALADASRDIANYLRNPEEIAKVAQALRVERDKAEAAQDFTRVRVLDDKLTNISLMQNGGLFDLSEGLTWEQREILGMALQAGLDGGKLSVSQVRAMVARGRVEASGGKAQGSTGSSHADAASDGQPALEVRNAEVLGRDGEVLVKQNPVTGEYEAVGIKALAAGGQGAGNLVVEAEKAALDRIGQNPKGADLAAKQSNTVLQLQSQRRIDDLAVQYNTKSIDPKDFQLSVGGKLLTADQKISMGAPVFVGASTSDVMNYFKQLAGVDKMPVAQIVPGKGVVYALTTDGGAKIALRNFSSSSHQTGASWTIDVMEKSINGGRRVEIKFK